MTAAAAHISSVYIIGWYVTWGLLKFNDCSKFLISCETDKGKHFGEVPW